MSAHVEFKTVITFFDLAWSPNKMSRASVEMVCNKIRNLDCKASQLHIRVRGDFYKVSLKYLKKLQGAKRGYNLQVPKS